MAASARLQKARSTLYDHIDGILAYCRHKVPFGMVEAINGNIKAITRRGRGYPDHEYLILKVQKMRRPGAFATGAAERRREASS